MIKATELRIGNHIANGTGKWVVGALDFVGGVYIKSVNDDKLVPIDMAYAVKPIPITEEWLLIFGFSRHHADYFNKLIFIKNVVDIETGKLNHSFDWGVYQKDDLGDGLYVRRGIRLSAVHQLQNLYFTLTGEELKEI